MDMGMGSLSEEQIIQRVEDVINESLASPSDLIVAIQDGVCLCKLANKIRKGSVPHIRYHGGLGTFKNLLSYLKACRKLGVPADLMFGVDDLCTRNVAKIISNLDALIAIYKSGGVLDCVANKNELGLLEQIAFGYCAEVWKCTWKGRIVAVKKLPESRRSSQARKSFSEEIALTSQLNHPNVIRVYDTYSVEDNEWMIMEYADGGDLNNYLTNLKQDLSWFFIWQLAIEAATSVAFLHSQGIIHRDIKSPNFLFVNNTLKIADFGLSTSNSFASIQTRTFANESGVGTVRWAAPETFELKPISTEKSDVYSLGVVLWELVTRKIPFGEARDLVVIKAVGKHKQRPEIPCNCPALFANIIEQCWCHSPEDRPTADQVRKSLLRSFEEFKSSNPNSQVP